MLNLKRRSGKRITAPGRPVGQLTRSLMSANVLCRSIPAGESGPSAAEKADPPETRARYEALAVGQSAVARTRRRLARQARELQVAGLRARRPLPQPAGAQDHDAAGPPPAQPVYTG